MRHFLIHTITTLFIIIFSQVVFGSINIYAQAAYSCGDTIEIRQGDKTSGFYRSGGDILITFTLTTLKTDEQIPIDLTFAYDKGRSPSNWYINENVIPISSADNKTVVLRIPQSYFQNNSGNTIFEAGVFSNPDCNPGDWLSCRDSIKRENGQECIQRVDVFDIDPGVDAPMEGNCSTTKNGNPPDRFTCYRTNNATTGRIEWDRISTSGNEDYIANCPTDSINDSILSCNATLASYGNASEWCVKCPSKLSSGAPEPGIRVITQAGESCGEAYVKCLPDVLECKIVSKRYEGSQMLDVKKCVYKDFAAQEGQYCLVGSNQCSNGLICLGMDRSNLISNYQIGSEGECMSSSGDDQLNRLVCDYSIPTSCDDYLEQLPGYKVARCMTGGYCAFDINPNGEIAKINKGLNEPSVAPIVPAPPSRFIEKCDGNLSCANCVARQESGGVFGSYQDAADAEFEYNKKVDEWKQARLDGGTYETAPTTKEYQFVYTGYIYTSLGCIDTTDNGLITRVVQIALGIIGGVILVRFLQAGMKLQGGGSPEDQAEAVEIITSAIVALLLFVMSMIVLRFIGFDVFQIFSPGTFQMS